MDGLVLLTGLKVRIRGRCIDGRGAPLRLEYEGKVGWTDGLRWMVDWSSRRGWGPWMCLWSILVTRGTAAKTR